MSDPRQAAIDRFRQQVQGVWLDVVLRANKDPDKLGFWLENAQRRTDDLAAKFYDHLTQPVPDNGKPATPARSK